MTGSSRTPISSHSSAAKPIRLVAGPPHADHLVAEFFWVRDRFAHRILWQRGPSTQAVLESVEGDETDEWPASPPWQQLAPQGDHALLALGMAGTSHWSGSLLATDGDAQLTWDIACRYRVSVGWLGQVYRWTQLPPNRMAGMIEAGGSLNPVATPAGSLSTPAEEFSRFQCHATSPELPATARWQLSFRFPSDRLP